MPRGRPKAKRINDAAEAFIGGEPSFTPDQEVSKEQLIVSLNWYNQQIDSKRAKKFLLDALKRAEVPKKTLTGFANIADVDCRTAGYLARMVERGAKFAPADQLQFENVTTGLVAAAEIESDHVEEKSSDKKKPDIQAYMRAKANNAIGALEELLDKRDYSEASTKEALAVVGGPMARWVLEWVASKQSEFNEVLKAKDEQIKEGYSNFSRKEVKSLLDYLGSVEGTLNHLKAVKAATRKPRARKAVSVEKVVSKVKYLKADESLKVVSVNPADIVGAQQLWVFNVKYRKLGVFHASDPQGLQVKGTTVLNFDEARSVCKTVRKPAEKLPELVAAGKVALRHFMDEIKAKPATLKGRLNGDVLLVRVVR